MSEKKQCKYKRGEWWKGDSGDREEREILAVNGNQIAWYNHSHDEEVITELSIPSIKAFLHTRIKDEHGQPVKQGPVLTADFLRSSTREEWNQARRDNPDEMPELNEAILTDCDFTGFDLHKSNLAGASLVRTNLSRANLSDANLHEANLQGVTLCEADIDGAKLAPNDIGGPGHILCALTDNEWETIQQGRK